MTLGVLRWDDGIFDLLVVALLVLISGAALISVGPGGPLWILGVPFVVLFPGYAIVAAIFPEQPGSGTTDLSTSTRGSNPGWVARVALSLVVSAIVVGVCGFVLGWASVLRLDPAVGAVVGVTLVSAVIAAARRLRLPRERRANPFTGGSSQFSTGAIGSNAVLVVSILVLVGSVAFVGAVPSDGEAFTESYLLSENSEGDLVAEDYPTTFVSGEGQPLYVGLENNEYRAINYEIEVVVQEINANGEIVAQQRLDRVDVALDHSENTVVEPDIAPTMTGEGLRLQFLVHKGDTADNPDQTLQLWINVVDETDE